MIVGTDRVIWNAARYSRGHGHVNWGLYGGDFVVILWW